MASTSSEAPPSSPPETPTINNSTKTKSIFSIRSYFVANLKAKFCVSKLKPVDNSHHNAAASSSATTKPNDHHNAAASSSATTKPNDHQGEDLAPSSELAIPNDLLLVDSALKNYTDHMTDQINLARDKFKELQQNSRSSERDFEELRKAIVKLKLQIPTQVNILSTTSKDDHHGGAALSPSSKLMHNDLLLVDSAFAETKEYMDHMSEKINQAHEKFKELQMLPSSPEREFDVTQKKKKREFDELRKAIKKLKVQIPSHVKFGSADSNRHRNRWPNINEAEDGMTHFFYKEPWVPFTSGYHIQRLLEAFHDLSDPLRWCLLCFFRFPPEATIKRTTMIYLWIGQGFTSWHLPRIEEDEGIRIFDELIEKGFIEPVYQNCSLVPDSCRMSLSVRSSLHNAAEGSGFTSNDTLDLDFGFVCCNPCDYGKSCLINVGEAIINCGPEIFENMKFIRSLYLGRWQNSAMHHIELANPKILHGVKNLFLLEFLSLRGISMITELPTAILELKLLKILDLRACHNLEVIPDNISLLKRLTHLDMSECYFLEHMPKSLALLSRLEVLKGFLIGDFNNNKQSCTLHDLSRLRELRKLNIYVRVKDFHRLWDFDDLKKFQGLQKLTISWGGCSLQGESSRQIQEEASMELLKQGPLTLPPGLQKLDLQCFPTERLTDWLRPAEIKELNKLYIRGGQLSDLGQSQKHQGEHWKVKILRLKYLSKLAIDWRDLRRSFPELVYLHQVECPKFTNFPCDESGVWMEKNAIYIQEQLQKYQNYSIKRFSIDRSHLFRLQFLSLRGISTITELPTVISELNLLTILDLRACHNLKVIPNNIGLLNRLTCLDMSECYLLEHMPKSLAQLSRLEVLKGFLIGDFNNNKQYACTLHDLSRLRELRKLNIYVRVKDFHRLWDFDDLKEFHGLQKLTISWGGCSLQGESGRQIQEEASMELLRRGPQTLPPGLQKLNLQCFPTERLTDWLRPAEIKGLDKLYIRGGQLSDLGQSRDHQGEYWEVNTLSLKYLNELAIDWREFRRLFPELVYLHQVECPKLTNFPCDESGVWYLFRSAQLQKYLWLTDRISC
ncbi:uncharacterized protein LOC131319025 [Rhododendron vialii]|uniref:uncharacterized protein LOC131319025 n=1 Tax=Rhododendron vialii TaxID=182163 RepID=UPI00265E7A4E|nr:uncharacterized protein LOC131319025 [Rhododendron vialii]